MVAGLSRLVRTSRTNCLFRSVSRFRREAISTDYFCPAVFCPPFAPRSIQNNMEEGIDFALYARHVFSLFNGLLPISLCVASSIVCMVSNIYFQLDGSGIKITELCSFLFFFVFLEKKNPNCNQSSVRKKLPDLKVKKLFSALNMKIIVLGNISDKFVYISIQVFNS